MAAPTKADLRDRILELGGTPPPGSATRAQLQAIVDDLTVGRPSPAPRSSPGSDRPPAQPPRCAGGRPLHTHVCRQCHLLRIDVCPMGKD